MNLLDFDEYKVITDPSNKELLKTVFDATLRHYQCEKNAELIFFSLSGSQSFNVHIENSDQDFFGVYQADIDRILSIEYNLKQSTFQTNLNNNNSNNNASTINPMIENKQPLVWLPNDSVEREQLLKIRSGTLDESVCYDLVKSMYLEFEYKFNQLKQQIDNSESIKREANLNFLNQWLVSIRREAIEKSKSSGIDDYYSIEEDNNNEPYRLAKELMNQYSIKGTLIYVGISGSYLHNLQDENSTKDWIGIYVAPTDDILSLIPPVLKLDSHGNITPSDEFIGTNLQPAPNRTSSGKKDTFSKGILLYEVGTAIQLLLNGNYRLSECLFSANIKDDNQFYTTKSWNDLLKMWKHFSNRTLAQQYWGIAKSEYSLSAGFLAMEADSILSGKLPIVSFEGKDKEFLMKLKIGNISNADDELNQLINQCKELVDQTELIL
eukprot:gene7985-9826_t